MACSEVKFESSGDNKSPWYTSIIITVRFIIILVNWFSYRLCLLIRQFFIIPNRMIWTSDSHVSLSPWISSARIWSVADDLCCSTL
jgi:hypothetical protein